MLIHVVAETPSRIRPIREIVEPLHRVIAVWPTEEPKLGADDVLIIDVDLRQAASIDRTREFLRRIGQVRQKIFVVDKGEHCSPSAPLRQTEGLHEWRISGSS
jgi:hypothetical protein